MSKISTFESKQGKVACSEEELFNFSTDIRNFEQFIPEGTASNIKIERDSCSFQVSMLGTVTIRISETSKFSKVVFFGNALQINDFYLVLNIHGISNSEAEVRIQISAELNPFLKMIADEPIKKFIDTLVNEMEKFNGWKNTI